MAPVLLANKYLLLKRIASGGMAEIFLAKQVGLDGFEKLVVIKRILPAFASQPSYVQMFLDEAKTAADLRHPNIVSTIEVAQNGESYFMVMEYLSGVDLRFVIRKLSAENELIPLEIAVGIIMEACAGLNYAHNKVDLKGRPLGIVHRDVSPQNIVLTFEGETKIVDFGIAHAANLKGEKKVGVLQGKFAYMSPEQANGQKLDHRSDQLSLAIVLYEITTGQRLFRRENQEDSLAAAFECEVTPPSQVIEGYPVALEKIVLRALSKSREQRYLNCEELRAALHEFMLSHHFHFSRSNLSSYLAKNFDVRQEPINDLAASYLYRETRSEPSRSKDVKPVEPFITALNVLPFAMAAMLFMALGFAFYVFITPVKEPLKIIKEAESAPGATAVFKRNEVVDRHCEPSEAIQISGRQNDMDCFTRLAMTDQKDAFNPSKDSIKSPSPIERIPVKAKKKQNGRLKIVVEPWGEIFVDGKRLGLTPLSAQKIVEGEHVVRIVNPSLAKTKTLKIVIRANQDTLVRHQF